MATGRLDNPKSQIRLLYVHEGSTKNQVKCSISSHALDSAPSFRAISYTWGDIQDQLAIALEDEQFPGLAARQCPVGANCEYALWQARHFYPNSYVWIDQVCINQDDLVEKAAQVAMMGSIYAKATQVLACIGLANESSDYIHQKLPILDTILPDLPGYWADYTPREAQAWWSTPSGDAALFEFADHWDNFCERPYFHRLWVVQEIFDEDKSRAQVLCGLTIMEWDQLVSLQWRLYDCFNRHVPAPTQRPKCSDAVARLNPVEWNDTISHDLLEMITFTSQLKCKDPRDRVYGILRLIDWEEFGMEPITPDYSLSCTELAVQILECVPKRDLGSISRLALVFGLDRQLLERNLGEQYRLAARSLSIRGARDYPICTSIEGAGRVEVNAVGRLVVVFGPRNASWNWTERLPEYDLTLQWDMWHHFWNHDNEVAMTCPDTKPGDLVVQTAYFSVIVRPQDATNFTVVGQAFVFQELMLADYDWTCNCWQPVPRHFSHKFICISFQASLRESLKVGLIYQETSLDHPDRLSLQFPRPGSVVRDITSDEWEPWQKIRPVEWHCQIHDYRGCMGNVNRKNGLLFAVASNCGAYVQVNKE